MDDSTDAYDQETESSGSCFLESGTSAVVWLSASVTHKLRRCTYVGVQTNGLHGGGIVWVGAVAEGLPTATKTTAERAVAMRIVHRARVAHCRKDGL